MARQAQGFLVPTTDVWNVGPIYDLEISEPFKDILVRLYQNLNNISLSLNARDLGYYDTQEFLNSQVFFPNPAFNSSTPVLASYRAVFRKVINFGMLPAAAGTKSVPHGILCLPSTSFTRIYATATDPVNFVYLPIPYASSVLANNIELNVDATNVNITVGIDRSAFTICYVILEYLQT
jgi:hypothetical protein